MKKKMMDGVKVSKEITFKSIFIGEYVEILTKIAVYEDGEALPLVIHGYILEIDDNLVYLGDTPLEIKSAVKREDIGYIEITEPMNIFEEILEQFPIPENKHEEN